MEIRKAGRSLMWNSGRLERATELTRASRGGRRQGVEEEDFNLELRNAGTSETPEAFSRGLEFLIRILRICPSPDFSSVPHLEFEP